MSVKTLRNREARGFYPKPNRNPHSRYRQYTRDDIEKLKRINREKAGIIRLKRYLKNPGKG
jgi:DNA-binding transcriptional MerR regulator